MEISGIYGIYNTVSERWYVGQSCDVLNRLRNHKSCLKKNTHHNQHLQRAFNKYGKDVFVFQILEICPVEQLNEREVFWISEKNSFANGYNQTLGGDGARGMVSPNRKAVVCLDTGEVFESILAASRSIGVPKTKLKDYLHRGLRCHGYWELLPDNYSEEWRVNRLKERQEMAKEARREGQKRARQVFKERHPSKEPYVNPNGYRKWSDEAKSRNKGKNGKPVIQLSMDGEVIAEYASSVIAGETLGISHRKIRMVCNGERNKTGGFRWEWKNAV